MGQLEALDHLAIELRAPGRLLGLQQRVARVVEPGAAGRQAPGVAPTPGVAARSSSRAAIWSASASASGEGPAPVARRPQVLQGVGHLVDLGGTEGRQALLELLDPRLHARASALGRRLVVLGLDLPRFGVLASARSAFTSASTRASSARAASASATDSGSSPVRAWSSRAASSEQSDRRLLVARADLDGGGLDLGSPRVGLLRLRNALGLLLDAAGGAARRSGRAAP